MLAVRMCARVFERKGGAGNMRGLCGPNDARQDKNRLDREERTDLTPETLDLRTSLSSLILLGQRRGQTLHLRP
jgi:hypothetical protein